MMMFVSCVRAEDKRAEWQALEALGCICALHGQTARAVDFLKRALLVLPLDHSGACAIVRAQSDVEPLTATFMFMFKSTQWSIVRWR